MENGENEIKNKGEIEMSESAKNHGEDLDLLGPDFRGYRRNKKK